jgi:hypothetical protein
MNDIKQHLVTTAQRWLSQQIDIAVEHNPRLSFIAKRLKDGLRNTVTNKVDMIDPYLPFITDEKGQLNIHSVSEELLNAFDEMPVRDYQYMGLDIEVGKGRIAVMFPDNIFTNLFLDNNKLMLNRTDLQDLISMFNEYK